MFIITVPSPSIFNSDQISQGNERYINDLSIALTDLFVFGNQILLDPKFRMLGNYKTLLAQEELIRAERDRSLLTEFFKYVVLGSESEVSHVVTTCQIPEAASIEESVIELNKMFCSDGILCEAASLPLLIEKGASPRDLSAIDQWRDSRIYELEQKGKTNPIAKDWDTIDNIIWRTVRQAKTIEFFDSIVGTVAPDIRPNRNSIEKWVKSFRFCLERWDESLEEAGRTQDPDRACVIYTKLKWFSNPPREDSRFRIKDQEKLSFNEKCLQNLLDNLKTPLERSWGGRVEIRIVPRRPADDTMHVRLIRAENRIVRIEPGLDFIRFQNGNWELFAGTRPHRGIGEEMEVISDWTSRHLLVESATPSEYFSTLTSGSQWNWEGDSG